MRANAGLTGRGHIYDGELKAMNKNTDRVTTALRDTLTAYALLEGTARASVAQQIFGVPAAQRLLPMLDELAHSVQRR